jgi:hypothetical protein
MNADKHNLSRTVQAALFSACKGRVADAEMPATLAARVHSRLSAVYQFVRIVFERSIK